MIRRINGIYSQDEGGEGWESWEFFVKQGEVRFIDNHLFKLSFSILFSRFWYPIYEIEKKDEKIEEYENT